MKSKLRKAFVKILALVLVFTLTFPSQILAQSLTKNSRKIYAKDTSLMGLEAIENNQGDKSAQNQESTLLKSDRKKEDLEKLEIEKSASLSQTTGQILYRIAIKTKEDLTEKIQAIFAINKNSKEEKLKLEKTVVIDENGTEIEIESQVKNPNILNQDKDIETLSATTESKNQEVVYYLSAQIEEKTFKNINENKVQIYSLDFVIKNQNEEILHQDRINFREKEENLEENLEEIVLEEKNQLEIIEENQIDASFKETNLLGDKKAEITWKDFIINPKSIDNVALNYQINLDENQDTKESKIKVDFYQACEEGFILKKEFSTEIPFAKDSELLIPQGFIAKIALTTTVKKDANPKEFTYNNKVIKNPSYKEETEKKKSEEEKKDSKEDPLPEGNKDNKDQTKEETSPIDLNKDALIGKFKEEEKLTALLELSIEKISKNIKSYNDGKISEEEFKNNLKNLAKDLDKENLKEILATLTSGLNEEKFKVAKIDIEKLIDEIYPKEEIKENTEEKENKTPQSKESNNENKDLDKEKSEENLKETNTDTENQTTQASEFDELLNKEKEDIKDSKVADKPLAKSIVDGIKGFFGQSDQQKADKDLKAALENPANKLADIQDVLTNIGEKYDLSRADQLKLMEDNKDSIASFINRDADKNFNPNLLFSKSPLRGPAVDGLKDKKFTIKTRFETSNQSGPIGVDQHFDIKLDDKLTVKDPNSLKPIVYKGEEVARASYDSKSNTIRYNITKPIADNVKIPLSIDVDYNIEKIKELDGDSNKHSIQNLITGIGVNETKLPQVVVDDNGNVINTVAEPGGDNILEIVDQGEDYQVYMDANGTPVLTDGEMTAIDWTVHFSSTKDLLELGLISNATLVKGCGLDKFENILLNGKPIDSNDITANEIEGKFGIRESKNHTLKESTKDVVINFQTPIIERQETYMIDFSVLLKNKGKTGAVRLLFENAFPEEKVREDTSTRVGMNNRTTVLGVFTSENTAKWTVTDGVSTGDDNHGFPLQTRELSGKQSLSSSRMVVYGIDTTTGKMVTKIEETNLNKTIPAKETNPSEVQLPGRIAVYEYKTDLKEDEGGYSLAGVNINKYQDITIDQTWAKKDQSQEMPAQGFRIEDQNGNLIDSFDIAAGPTGKDNRTIVRNVKTWNIDENGNEEKIIHQIEQILPEDQQIGSTTYSYKEKYNYLSIEDGHYKLYNYISEATQEKEASFTLVKVDSKDPDKRLPGSTFTLMNSNSKTTISTDANGQAKFTNISPGTYNLIENNAPRGYKVDQSPKQVIVDNNGNISVKGSNISMTGGNVQTFISRNPDWPSYMSALYYGNVDNEGNIEFYIHLQPEANGNTNKNTRLNLNLSGGQITGVEVLDVGPNQRNTVYNSMINQSADTITGNNLINKGVANDITGNDGVTDDYTGKTGYQIKFPSERFINDWGFLVKVTAKGSKTSSVSFDWLTDNNRTSQEAKLQENITLATKDQAHDDILLTVTNEEFPKKPVEITKINSDKKTLSNTNFVIKDENDHVISTKITGVDGKADFGNLPAGKYTIEEDKAPVGYIKSKVVFDVTVGEDGSIKYKARFKDNSGVPIPNQDYVIEEVDVGQSAGKPQISQLYQKFWLREKQTNPDEGRTGYQQGIWEAYGLESHVYDASFHIENISPGGRFKIQFDRNLNFKQYVYEIPPLKLGGKEVAKPYFNYDTNTLTYIFNDDVNVTSGDFDIQIIGIIPDKYYATQTDKNYGYDFNIVFDPDGINTNLPVNIKTDYYGYDDQRGLATSHYFTDIYTGEDGNEYVKGISYYNPYYTSEGGSPTLRYDWISADRTASTGMDNYIASGKPAFELDEMKVYKVYGNAEQKKKLMPLSFGIRPEQDPNYNLVYSKTNIIDTGSFSDQQGSYKVIYDQNKIKSQGTVAGSYANRPLEIKFPAIKNNEGYAIVQIFRITDKEKFKSKWRVYYINNNKQAAAAYQLGNSNKTSGQATGQEIPKFYTQQVKLIDKPYTPGLFMIRKHDQADKNKILKEAVFTLTKEDDGSHINRSTDKTGVVTFSQLAPGRYELVESLAPEGYNKSDSKWQVTVTNDGYVRIVESSITGSSTSTEGNNITINVANKHKSAKFKVYKKDHDAKPLAGAKFKITKQGDDTFIARGISATNGVVEFDKEMTDGIYILEEEEAPVGYKKLNRKYVIEVANGTSKIYNYVAIPEEGATLSYMSENGYHWIDVKNRKTDGWSPTDNRWTGWLDNSQEARYIGTRIIAKKDNENYVIQRFVVNPQGRNIDATKLSIHREKPNFTNMDWYDGNADIKVFKLDQGVSGLISDIRLSNYGAEDITDRVTKKRETGKLGEPDRLNLSLPSTDKPIVVDIKLPYKSENGGVGLGADWIVGNNVYWKSDYYERVYDIKLGDPTVAEAGNIKGSYISEGSLDVINENKRFSFQLTKVKLSDDSPIKGATFKLIGLDPSEDEQVVTTSTDGIVKFDSLKAGQYKLIEVQPAAGYDDATSDWTVTITDEGKVWIKENQKEGGEQLLKLVDKNSARRLRSLAAKRSPLRAESDWETIDPARSEKTSLSITRSTDDPVVLETRMTEINKVDNKFRQVFLFGQSTFGDKTRKIQIHSQPEEFDVRANDPKKAIVKVYTVTGSSLDNLGTKTEITTVKFTQKSVNNHFRLINDSIPTSVKGNILVEIETYYEDGKGIGLGADYISNTTQPRYSTNWIGESYASEDKINQFKKFTVTFDGNGGTGKMDPVTVEENTEYELPTCTFVAPNGQEFDGWLVNGEKKNVGDKITVTSHLTIKAQWRDKAPEKVTITFDAGDGSGSMADEKVNVGSNYQLPANGFTAPSGKEFKAWSVNEQELQPGATILVNADTTITALWKDKEEETYTVSVSADMANGTVIPDKSSYKENEIVTLTITPDTDYELDTLVAVDGSGKVVNIDKANYTFAMPKSNVTISATFKKTNDEVIIPDGSVEITGDKVAKISNKQTGIALKIFKTKTGEDVVPGAEFKVTKYSDEYKTIDESFGENGSVTGISDDKGNVIFKDTQGKEVKLPKGNYILEETKAAVGYKKPTNPWKLKVVEKEGNLVIEYDGPDKTPSEFLTENDTLFAGESATTDTIKYKAIVKSIDPTLKTFVQRIYIDTRAYNGGPVNVQITPVKKREEIDTPGQSPKTIGEGVKTAYRTTYKISNPPANLTDDQINHILREYDVNTENVDIINTARWRPFDWGFDEDQINLTNDGIYFIDIEGYYDDNIKAEDLAKIELNIEFMTERYFWQRINTDNGLSWKLGGSYQRGAEAYNIYNADGKLNERGTYQAEGQKYPNWLSKELTFASGKYKAGIVAVPNGYNDSSIQKSKTSIDIKSLYYSENSKIVPDYGMTIKNEQELYNVTFSKHGKDDPTWENTGKEVADNRLEGAIFKLEKKEGSFWYEIPGEAYVASAFNGYFGFRGLDPGRYRLIEVKAPEGYLKLDGTLLEFTIKTVDAEEGIIINPKTGTSVNLKDVKIIFPDDKDDPKEEYDIKNLDIITDPETSETKKFSELATIDVEKYLVRNPKTNKTFPLKEVNVVTVEKVTEIQNGQEVEVDKKFIFTIKETKIIPKAKGYVTLEYGSANGVYQYSDGNIKNGGKLVDYVTQATAKNMGEIINEKPGKGKVTITKVDDKGNPIVGHRDKDGNLVGGAKFEATKLGTKKNPDEGSKEGIYYGTTDEKGKVTIEGLPLGHYKLQEVEAPNGYVNDGKIWHFIVGGKELDPYADDTSTGGVDVSSHIELTSSTMTVVRPTDDGTSGNSEMRPHVGQSMEFDNEYKIKDGLKINPGDYFVLKLTDNMDLNGIRTDENTGLDLFGEGVGTIAKAKYDKEKGTITYTFTKYAEQYTLKDFRNTMTTHITLDKVKKSSNEKVGFAIKDQTPITHDIYVNYILSTERRWDQYRANKLNMDSKIVSFNQKTGYFVHYIYINRMRESTVDDLIFKYKPTKDVNNLTMDVYRLKNNNDQGLANDMPVSFGVDENSPNLEKVKSTQPQDIATDQLTSTNVGKFDANKSVIVKVSGYIDTDNLTTYKGYSYLNNSYYNNYYNQYYSSVDMYRWDEVYVFENEATASATLEYEVVNPINKITIRKVDQEGNKLTGAKFRLQKDAGGIGVESWKNLDNAYGASTEVDENGKLSYEKLDPGSYRIIEDKAPDGYRIESKDGEVLRFEVKKSGAIYKIVKDKNEDGSETNRQVKINGDEIIDIENYKENKISFKKTSEDGKTPLAGAEFEVWYKKNLYDKDYSNSLLKLYEKNIADGKVDRIVANKDDKAPDGYTEVKKFTSDANGLVEFKFYNDGYYAIKEIRAPKGYIKSNNFVKEFVVINGELKEELVAIKKDGTLIGGKDLEMSFIINKDHKEITYKKETLTSYLTEFKLDAENLEIDPFNIRQSLQPIVEVYKKSITDTDWLMIDTKEVKNTLRRTENVNIDLHSLLEKINGAKSDEDIKSTDSIKIVVKAKFKNNSADENGKLTTPTSITETVNIKGGDNGADIAATRKVTINSTNPGLESQFYENITNGMEIVIVNKQAVYPFTGGNGTLFYALCGFVVMIIGVLFYAFYERNKRRTLRYKARK